MIKTRKKFHLSQVLLVIVFMLTIPLSACTENQKEEEQKTSTLTKELTRLKENIKNFASSKTEEYSNEVESILEDQKAKLSELSGAAKENLQKRYDQLQQEYNEAKNAADDKQKELYSSLVDKLDKLNDDIEKSTKK